MENVKVMCDAQDEILVASTLSAEKWIEEPPMTYISCFADVYMTQQTSIWLRLWERLKLLTTIALGREYRLYDMVIGGYKDHKALGDFFAEQAKRCANWERKERRTKTKKQKKSDTP